MTLKELLRIIEEMKNDLVYTQRLEERWVSEQKRFPLIYKYIAKQREFFEQQIDKAMMADLDNFKLDDYVRERLGIRTERLKTAQVAPPAQEKAEEPAAKAPRPEPPKIEKPKIQKPRIEKPKIEKPKIEKPRPEPPKIEKPGLALDETEAVKEEETKNARKVLEEAAAATALKMRKGSPEPATQPVAPEKVDKKEETAVEKAPAKPAEKAPAADKASSRDKLRRLASEVLNEVKKSKTD